MVLVSDTYNFMYLVNPKTGSTSMRIYLRCYGKYIKDSQYDIYTLQDKIKDISVTYNYNMYHNNITQYALHRLFVNGIPSNQNTHMEQSVLTSNAVPSNHFSLLTNSNILLMYNSTTILNNCVAVAF
jgi:hypothetical protein